MRVASSTTARIRSVSGTAPAAVVSGAPPAGAAVVTGAGELGVELLIHGVVSSDEEPVSRASVRQALASALHRADAFQISRVAIAPFGLGAGNLDIEDSADVMMDVIAEHMRRARFPSSVVIVAETPLEEQVLRQRMERQR